MIGLTPRQDSLLAYLKAHAATSNGIGPSYREMMSGCGIQSLSTINRLLVSLEERGLIRRIPNRTRAIEIVEQNPLHRAATSDLVDELTRRGWFRQVAA